MPTDELITTAQAGALIGKSARTVIRLGESGALPVAQKLPGPNGAFLFHRADVVALASTVRTAAEPVESASA